VERLDFCAFEAVTTTAFASFRCCS